MGAPNRRSSTGFGLVKGVALAAGALAAISAGVQRTAFATAPAGRVPAAATSTAVSKASRQTLAGRRSATHGARLSKAQVHSLVARHAKQVDLTGKVAFIAGIGDASGYGWAIARELANAGATILIGTWPPVLKMFQMSLKKSATEEARRLDDGSLMEIAKIYPLDAVFDTPEDVTDDIKANKRYAGLDAFTIQEVVDQVKADYGKVDILVHSLANGPEVTKPLMETSRKGYLAASSSSAYSMVSMVSRFAPMMPPGSAVISLTYFASVRVIPGYGGGMSSAKAQLESDTRTLAWEAGRKYGIRVNTISAGPLKSRAASAIGGKPGEKTFIERAIDYSTVNAPLAKDLYAEHIGTAALSLCSPLMQAVSGMTLYVDNGLNIMGQSIDSPAYEGLPPPPTTPEFGS